MPNQNVYVQQAGTKDLSRWLQLSLRRNGELVLHLTDLCLPGRVSGLEQVTCPTELFTSVTAGSPLQITANNGYLMARPDNGLLHIEFRSIQDKNATKAAVCLEEVQARLWDLEGQLTKA